MSQDIYERLILTLITGIAQAPPPRALNIIIMSIAASIGSQALLQLGVSLSDIALM